MKITFKKEKGWWPEQRRNLARRVMHHAKYVTGLVPDEGYAYDIKVKVILTKFKNCLLYTSPSPRD